MPGAHPHHRQRHHPDEGADGRQLRPDRVAVAQVPWRQGPPARVMAVSLQTLLPAGWFHSTMPPRTSPERRVKAPSRRPIAMGVTTLVVGVANVARPEATRRL